MSGTLGKTIFPHVSTAPQATSPTGNEQFLVVPRLVDLVENPTPLQRFGSVKISGALSSLPSVWLVVSGWHAKLSASIAHLVEQLR